MNPAPSLAASTGTSRRNLVLGFGSSAAGTLVTYAVSFAVVPFVLHRVGAEIYGAWATIASFLAVGGLADAGIRTEIIRRVGSAQGQGDHDELARSVRQGVTLLAALAAAIALIGVAAAPAVRAIAFPRGVSGYGAGELDLLIRCVFGLLAGSLVANGYFGVLRGVQRGDVEATALMLSAPASAVVTAVGVSQGWGLWALLMGGLAGLLVTVAWSSVGVRHLVPGLRLRLVALSGPVVRGYLALSGLALLSQVSEVIDSQWDKVVLSRYVGSAAVTSFQIGTNLVLQGKALALLPLAPLLVAIAELRHREDERMEALFGLMTKAGMVMASVVLGAICVFAPAFLRLWLSPGEAIEGAAVGARLFTVAVGLNLFCAPLALRAFGEGWYAMTAVSAASNVVVNCLLSLVLTIAIGFNCALYGSIVGNLVGCALMVVLMRRRLGLGWSPMPCRALLIGVTCGSFGLLAGFGHVRTWPALLAAGGAYVMVVGVACARAEGLAIPALLGRRMT